MIAWLAACGGTPPDVVLVTLDTTRADHVGAWDPAHPTPALDALAADGRRYANAWSPVPLTVPAHASLLTGRYPVHTGVRGNGDALPPAATTLAEHLHARGYATAAFVGAVVTSRAFGFGQGFDTFDDDFIGEERPADQVADAALAWLARTEPARRPRFAWVHLYDPHLPNRPTPGRPDPYDAAIGACDDAVARLRAATSGRPTLFAVAADHGESRGEHGEVAHGRFVYPATQRVPWLLAGPGVRAGEVVHADVSLVDLAPTLLAAAGLPPLPDADGRSSPRAPVHLESRELLRRYGVAPQIGVIDGGWLLVDAPRPELYDLRADPAATRDRAADEPERVAALRAAAEGLRDGAEAERTALDPAVARQLAALGYAVGGAEPAGPPVDAKDRRSLISRAEQAELLTLAGRYADAEALLAALIAEHPDVAELHGRRAWVLLGLGRADDAEAELRAALRLDPADPTLQVGLAARLAAARRYREAAELFRAAAEATPNAVGTRAMALRALLDDGRPGEAVALGRTWRERWPDDLGVAGLLGVALARARQPEQALPLLELGASAERPELGVRYTLSAIVAGRGDRARAVALLDAELARFPASAEALLARCAWHRAAGETDAMLALAARARAVAAEDPSAWACEAAAELDRGDRAAARAAAARALAAAPDLPLAREVAAAAERPGAVGWPE